MSRIRTGRITPGARSKVGRKEEMEEVEGGSGFWSCWCLGILLGSILPAHILHMGLGFTDFKKITHRSPTLAIDLTPNTYYTSSYE